MNEGNENEVPKRISKLEEDENQIQNIRVKKRKKNEETSKVTKRESDNYSRNISFQNQEDTSGGKTFEEISFHHNKGSTSYPGREKALRRVKESINQQNSSYHNKKTSVYKELRKIIDKQKMAMRYIHIALTKFQCVTDTLQKLIDDEIISCKEEYPDEREVDVDCFGEYLLNTEIPELQEVSSGTNTKLVSNSSSECNNSSAVSSGVEPMKLTEMNEGDSEHWINSSNVDLYIKDNDSCKGKGVYAGRKYMEGEFITTIKGEVKEGSPPSVSQKSILKFIHQGLQKWLDSSGVKSSSSFGNLMNVDDKNSNCKIIIKEDAFGTPNICIFAVREVEKDEELFCDYVSPAVPNQYSWREKENYKTVPSEKVESQEARLKPSEVKTETRKYSTSQHNNKASYCEVLNHSLFDESESSILEEEKLLSEILQIPINMKCEPEDDSTDSNLECILNDDDDTEIPQNENSIFVRQSYNTPDRRVWDKLQYCVYCYKGFTNITKHLFNNHKTESDVIKILALPKFSKLRKLMLEKLRNKGNYYHNCQVIKQGRGEIIPWRCPPHFISYKKYVSCKHCLGFFLRDEYLKHEKQCPHKDFAG